MILLLFKENNLTIQQKKRVEISPKQAKKTTTKKGITMTEKAIQC